MRSAPPRPRHDDKYAWGGGPWSYGVGDALGAETPGESSERIDSAALRALAGNLEYARTLGARIEKQRATDVGRALAEFARREQVTVAVFGRSRRRRLLGRRRTPLDAFMELAPEVDVMLIGEAPERR